MVPWCSYVADLSALSAVAAQACLPGRRRQAGVAAQAGAWDGSEVVGCCQLVCLPGRRRQVSLSLRRGG